MFSCLNSGKTDRFIQLCELSNVIQQIHWQLFLSFKAQAYLKDCIVKYLMMGELGSIVPVLSVLLCEREWK